MVETREPDTFGKVKHEEDGVIVLCRNVLIKKKIKIEEV